MHRKIRLRGGFGLFLVSFLFLVLSMRSSPAVAAFYAAAGKVDITPDPENERTYLAGYGSTGRRAGGIHDPLYARALVVSDGTREVALVSVDAIGIFREDVLAIRRLLGWEAGHSYLFLAATHNHSAPDTMGLWGPAIGVSGVNSRHHRRMREAIAGLVRELAGRLQESRLTAARAELDPRGLCTDSRDPVVIDPELQALRVETRGRIAATVLRWSCHAEVMDRTNHQLTADFPGEVCARVEEKTGGSCVFFNGAIGGLLTPEADPSRSEFEESKRIGGRIADEALAALAHSGNRPLEGNVRFESRTLRVPVENSRYLLFLRSLTFGHRLLNADGSPMPWWKEWWLPLRQLLFFPLPDRLRPWIETEISLVHIGPVKLLGIPGELFPELAIGGYDGQYRFEHPLIRPDNPNPPDLGKAPQGPYLRERLRARYGWLIGLANDELGYIVPSYDFQATRSRSMRPQPKGTHYEETNSIGPSVTGILLNGYDELLGGGPPPVN